MHPFDDHCQWCGHPSWQGPHGLGVKMWQPHDCPNKPPLTAEEGAAVAFGIVGMFGALREAFENGCSSCGGPLGCRPGCYWYGPHDCERQGCSFGHGDSCYYCGADDTTAKDGSYPYIQWITDGRPELPVPSPGDT